MTLQAKKLYRTKNVMPIGARQRYERTTYVRPSSVWIAESLRDVHEDMCVDDFFDDEHVETVRARLRERELTSGDKVVALRELNGEGRRLWLVRGHAAGLDKTSYADNYYFTTQQLAADLVEQPLTLEYWLQQEHVGPELFIKALQLAIDNGQLKLDDLQRYVMEYLATRKKS